MKVVRFIILAGASSLLSLLSCADEKASTTKISSRQQTVDELARKGGKKVEIDQGDEVAHSTSSEVSDAEGLGLVVLPQSIIDVDALTDWSAPTIVVTKNPAHKEPGTITITWNNRYPNRSYTIYQCISTSKDQGAPCEANAALSPIYEVDPSFPPTRTSQPITVSRDDLDDESVEGLIRYYTYRIRATDAVINNIYTDHAVIAFRKLE